MIDVTKEGKRNWDYVHIQNFRRACRKHNQKVRRLGIDPELKTKGGQLQLTSLPLLESKD